MAKFDLFGVNGNAFSVMGYVLNAMRQRGFSNSDMDHYKKDAMSGDYDHLLAISLEMIDQCNETFESDTGLDMDDISDRLAYWFKTNCNKHCYDSHRKWVRNMEMAINHNNGSMVIDAIEYLSELYDKDRLHDSIDEIEDVIADLADSALNG